MYKIIIGILLGFAITKQVAAQTNLPFIKQELTKTNKYYDSAFYMGFDVKMNYQTDTVFGKYEIDAMQGTYILNGKKLFYNIDNTIYMQNDSMSIMLMQDEKQMLVTKNTTINKAALFPVKNFIDSIIDSVAVYYNIQYQTLPDDVKCITLTVLNDTMPVPYTKLLVKYNTDSYKVEEIQLTQRMLSDDLMLIRPTNPYYKGTTTLTFTNYKNVNNAQELNEWEYILYNAQKKKYYTTAKYSDYELIVMGIPEAEDESGEKVYKEKM